MDASNATQTQNGRLDLNTATIHHLPLSTIHHPPFKSTIHHSPYIPCHLGPSRVIPSHPVLDFLISNAPSKQRKRTPQTHLKRKMDDWADFPSKVFYRGMPTVPSRAIPGHHGPSRAIPGHPVLDFLISNAFSKQRKRSSNAPQTHFLCLLMPNGRLERTSNAKCTIGLGHNVHPSHALMPSDAKWTPQTHLKRKMDDWTWTQCSSFTRS